MQEVLNYLVSVIIILGNLILLPAGSLAGEYPKVDNPYVNDYAHLLTPEDVAGIGTMFTKLRTDSEIEAVVLTISSFKKYETEDATLEEFATHLFNTWGIGNKEKNNGVLILVAVNDRKMRIELGAGYPRSMDRKMKVVIDEFMLPQFKRNNYSRGIYQGRAVKFLQEHESSCKIEIFTNLFNRNGHVSAQLHFSRRKSADSISQPDEFNGTSSKNS